MTQQNVTIDTGTIPPDFKDPISMKEARDELRDKSILICPDTCALLRMAKTHERKKHIFDRVDNWFQEMQHCKDLLESNSIGWLVPEQIKREFEDKKNNTDIEKIEHIKSASIANGMFTNKNLKGINSTLKSTFDELIFLAAENQKKIIENSIVLEEYNDTVCYAWEMVHKNQFPSHNKPQMKDSVIIYHLLEFIDPYSLKQLQSTQNNEQLETLSKPHKPLYFWTFDDGILEGIKGNSTELINKIKNSLEIVYDLRQIMRMDTSI